MNELAPTILFEELWPEIDEGWVETVARSKGLSLTESKGHPGTPSPILGGPKPMTLSEPARKIVDKLRRQRHWGHASLPIEALQKITHLSSKEIDEAINELRERHLLDHAGGNRGVVSLDPAMKDEIESIQ